MTDKAWLLSPAAIQAAKKCIFIVHEELGVKLRLSHPQFMELLREYCDLTDCWRLQDAYRELAGFAGITYIVPAANSSTASVESKQSELLKVSRASKVSKASKASKASNVSIASIALAAAKSASSVSEEPETLTLKPKRAITLTGIDGGKAADDKTDSLDASEMIDYHGKRYARFDENGREFTGLYRGQPSYR